MKIIVLLCTRIFKKTNRKEERFLKMAIRIEMRNIKMVDVVKGRKKKKFKKIVKRHFQNSC